MTTPDTDLKLITGEPDRTKYLGSSDCAAIIGVGAFEQTPLTVYFKKIGEQVDLMDDKQRLFLDRRKRWEGPIVEMLREEFEGNIVAINQRYVDPQFDFLAAEVDFEWSDHDGVIQNGEIKTCSPFAFGERQGWGEAGTADIPIHYAAQVMFSLMVTGRDTCIVAAMVGLDNMIFYRVNRDEETIREMRLRCVRFWRDNVMQRIPPDPISLADCQRLTLGMRGHPVEADDDLFEDLRTLNALRESGRAMDEEHAELMFKITKRIISAWPGVSSSLPSLLRSQDKATITRKGKEIASWNLQNTTRLQAKELKAAMPKIYAAFAKTTASRVLRFKKQDSKKEITT